ncbi:MAG: ComEC/Rec2 family competence protein [Candidatus Levybacteria bacterium]|nr:ComEC/Rec2 family competence protein [Candidatus Levybacteria bacterium]
MTSIKIAIILGIMIIALSLRFLLFYQNNIVYKDNQNISFKTTLLSEPKIFSRYQKISADLESGDKISLIIPRYPEYHYGQTLYVSGALRAKNTVKAISQKQLLPKKEKIVLSMYFPKTELVVNSNNFSFKLIEPVLAVTSFIRQDIISLFGKTLPPSESGLFLGIVFGIKEEMPKTFTDSLRITGVMHVIAASGMNVTIIGGFLSSIFAFFFKRQIALFASIAGIIFYAILAGLEPSIVRASIMGALVFSSQILGRQSLALYSLSLAGFIMLFISPGLISDIGFQLSFISTLGILYIRPLFQKRGLKIILKKSIIGEDMATTVSAQIAALPILFANFGSYSIISVLVNGLVLWTVPILMVLGGLGAIFGVLLEPVGKIFLYLSLPFLLYFEKLVSFFSVFNAGFNFESVPWQLITGYYAVLISVLLFFRTVRK